MDGVFIALTSGWLFWGGQAYADSSITLVARVGEPLSHKFVPKPCQGDPVLKGGPLEVSGYC